MDVDAALRRAQQLIAGGDYPAAMREYRAAEKRSPYDERVLCGKALAFMSDGRTDRAVSCMADASVSNPGAAYPHGVAGAAMHAQGSPGDALECYEMMLSADPGEAAAYVRKAQALADLGMEKESEAAIRACLGASLSGRESHKERKRLRVMGARLARGEPPRFRVSDSATFIPGLWELLDVLFGPEKPDPGEESDLQGIGIVGSGDFAGHMRAMDGPFGSLLGPAKALCIKGDLLMDEDRADEASACYDRAIKAEPGDMLAYSHKADMLEDSGDRAGALECLRAARAVAVRGSVNVMVQKDLRGLLDQLEDGQEYPESDAMSQAATRGFWAAGRRAGPGAAPARQSGGLFPPGLLDGLGGAPGSGRRR